MGSHGPSLPFGTIAGACWGTIMVLATSQAADLTRMSPELRVPVVLFLVGIASPALICWRLAPSADQLGDVARRGIGPLTPLPRWRFYAVAAAVLYTAAFLLDAVALHTRAGSADVLNLTSAGAVMLAAACAVIWALGPRLAAGSEGFKLGLDGAQALCKQFGLEHPGVSSELHPSLPPTPANKFLL